MFHEATKRGHVTLEAVSHGDRPNGEGNFHDLTEMVKCARLA
jgi:hypothetical protein